jgi:tRNA (guanine37-N1)-methyltransferase
MRLKEKLQGIVPEEYLCKLSNRFHVVGDIAVLSLPSELEAYKKEIAWGVLSQGKYIRTVLNKTTRLEGERRVANFEHLAGDGMVTMHKEFGFVYHLDVTRVFFNSHLGHERMRVASHVKAGERVLVPFAGVGPFAVPLAARGARVVALEKNREACLWLAENAWLNGVGEEIFVINADAFYVAQMIRPDFDRVVIPTPYGMDQFLEIALPLVKEGGMLHFYTFKKLHQIDGLKKTYEDMGLMVVYCRSCGNVAPGVCRWVFDMVKSRS